MPCDFVVKNGWKTRSRAVSGKPGPLSLIDERAGALRAIDVRDSTTTVGAIAARGARLDGVAEQIAERLPEQHVVALDGRELSGDDDVAVERAGVGAQVVGRALGDGTQDRRATRLSCVGRAKLRKFVTTSRIASVSARMPSTYGRNAGGNAFEIEQAAVAVNGGQPVAELVRDAGGELADPRQAVLQPHLLLERHDGREIREEANDAVRRRRLAEERRHCQAECSDAPVARGNLDGAPNDRRGRC